MSIAFVVTTLVVVASPGTGVVFTLAAGLARGRRASVVAAFGCTLGIVPHIAAALLGLAALLYTSSVAFQALKIVGVVYLLFMAWRTWRDHGALHVDAELEAPTAKPSATGWKLGSPSATRGPDARTPRQVIVSAILVNLLNPKLSVFFVAFLPQFAHGIGSMVVLSVAFMVATFVVFVAYGLAASWVRRHVVQRPRVLAWMRRVFAASFVGLGAKLAVTQR